MQETGEELYYKCRVSFSILYSFAIFTVDFKHKVTLRITYKIHVFLSVVALSAAACLCPKFAISQTIVDTVNHKKQADSVAMSLNDTVRLRTDSIATTKTDTSSAVLSATSADSTSAGDSLVIRRAKTKEKKERSKTLDSYFFPDTLMKHKVLIWTVNKYR